MTRDEAHAMITDEMVEAAAEAMKQRRRDELDECLERATYEEMAKLALTAANAAAWRPIESAPRDGTGVIVTDGLGVYGEAWWHDGDHVWLGCDGCYPTRWQPLPAPPPPQQEGE